MADQASLPALLDGLVQSLTSALKSIPGNTSLVPLQDGISLLDVKNELLLSYLENLVFLIILKIRSTNDIRDCQDLNDAVIGKLVELRVYLEKGIRPLEGHLKYQIEKVIRVASDAERTSTLVNGSNGMNTRPIRANSQDSDEGSIENSPTNTTLKASEIDDLQYRPNPSAFVRPLNAAAEEEDAKSKDGIYRPPQIAPTVMPTTGSHERQARKPNKSATLEEFVNTELSTAPLAEPSIGTNIVSGGRRSKSEREKKEEAERQNYEEANYVRLPKESKKERAKKRGRQDAGYGGEEWRGLGEGIERIERLTKRKASDSRGALERSRKRLKENKPAINMEVGHEFQKRVKALDGRRRDRGRRK